MVTEMEVCDETEPRPVIAGDTQGKGYMKSRHCKESCDIECWGRVTQRQVAKPIKDSSCHIGLIIS